jgi:hypothetical protein
MNRALRRAIRVRISAEQAKVKRRGKMARRLKDLKEVKIERPPRMKLSAKESLKRTQEFDKRKEQFIATIRKGKG